MGAARSRATKKQRAHAARILKRKLLRNHASHGDAEMRAVSTPAASRTAAASEAINAME